MSKIGIGILDIGTQDELNATYASIPEGTENVFVVSNTSNRLPDCNRKQYSTKVQKATLRNWLLSQFRLNEIENYFFIQSGFVIKDHDVFKNTVKVSDCFGIGLFTGPENSNVTIEDDSENLELVISIKLNEDIVYLNSKTVDEFGYFDERYFGGANLDVLDYVLRIRDKEKYIPTGYYATIKHEFSPKEDSINLDVQKNDKHISYAYAYFLHTHKYLPGQNDPKVAEKNELMDSLEKLQSQYGKK